MLTPELEQLIQYALADGVLTDKERAVLMKKAEAAGVDLDEFEMILERPVTTTLRPTATEASHTGCVWCAYENACGFFDAYGRL